MKWRNPIKYNTGKAFLNGGYTWQVEDAPNKTGFARGHAQTTVFLGGQWVLRSPATQIQGVLAHELSHLMRAGDEDLYMDEFNAYYKQALVQGGTGPRTPAQLRTRLQDIQTAIAKYDWWPTIGKKQQEEWIRSVTGLRGWNPTNSWKQAKLKDLMDEEARVATVVRHIGTMDRSDKRASRDAVRADGAHYLRYGKYKTDDRAAIWTALGGRGTAPER
jgi:hypothetical protein